MEDNDTTADDIICSVDTCVKELQLKAWGTPVIFREKLDLMAQKHMMVIRKKVEQLIPDCCFGCKGNSDIFRKIMISGVWRACTTS